MPGYGSQYNFFADDSDNTITLLINGEETQWPLPTQEAAGSIVGEYARTGVRYYYAENPEGNFEAGIVGMERVVADSGLPVISYEEGTLKRTNSSMDVATVSEINGKGWYFLAEDYNSERITEPSEGSKQWIKFLNKLAAGFGPDHEDVSRFGQQ